MLQSHGGERVSARPIGVRVETLWGVVTPPTGLAITSVARRLSLWWLGGAWVYAWPVAIEYAEGQRTRRTRITHVRRRAFAMFATLGLAAVAVFVARRVSDAWRAS
jgi:hypothetical protein